VSMCLSQLGHSLLMSQQTFTEEADTLVLYTLSVAVSEHCQHCHLSQLLHAVAAVSAKYPSVRTIIALYAADDNS